MKIKILIISTVLIGLLPTLFTFAQTPTSESAVQILQQRIAELQKQITDLRAQLEIVKKTEVSVTKNIIFTKTLQRGMRNAEVTKLQEFLKQSQEIYPEGLVTGYFGPLTEAAVKRFQEKHGIESIGIVGPKTRQKLNELFSVQEKIEESKEIIPSVLIMPTPSPTPAPTPQFQSGPPPNWPDWLKQERENSIEDVRAMEEWVGGFGEKTLNNDKLPLLLEWAKAYDIKLIGYRNTHNYLLNNIYNPTTDRASLTAVPALNYAYDQLQKLPPHLVNLFRGNVMIFTIKPGGYSYAHSIWREVELSYQYQKKRSELTIEERGEHLNVEPNIFPDNLGGSYTDSMDIFFALSTNAGVTTHEFGHIVDLHGIEMHKGRDYTLGKTDEGIRALYEEYKSLFSILTHDSNIKEDFADYFDDYVNRPAEFREEAAEESIIAQKYEFLKTKIFLGKEY